MGTLAAFARTLTLGSALELILPPLLHVSASWPNHTLGLDVEGTPPAAHPGGNSYRSFMTFCMSTPAVHSSSLLFLLRPPAPVSYSPSFFVISWYPRGGKKTRTQGSSRFRGNPSLLSLLAQTILYLVYTLFSFLFVLDHLPAGAPSGFPSARFRMLLTPPQQ